MPKKSWTSSKKPATASSRPYKEFIIFDIVCRNFVDILCKTEAVNELDVNQARKELERFVRNPETLSIWSREFFLDVATRIRFV
jgi:hypothetical protein